MLLFLDLTFYNSNTQVGKDFKSTVERFRDSNK